MKKILLLAAALLVTAGCQKLGRDDVPVGDMFWASSNVGSTTHKGLGLTFRWQNVRTPPYGYRIPSQEDWRALYNACEWHLCDDQDLIYVIGAPASGYEIYIPLQWKYDVIDNCPQALYWTSDESNIYGKRVACRWIGKDNDGKVNIEMDDFSPSEPNTKFKVRYIKD